MFIPGSERQSLIEQEFLFSPVKAGGSGCLSILNPVKYFSKVHRHGLQPYPRPATAFSSGEKSIKGTVCFMASGQKAWMYHRQ